MPEDSGGLEDASARAKAWVGIVANPGAGRGKGRLRVHRLIQSLGRQGVRVRIAWTPHERASMVAESGQDPHCGCLVAAGGDGTVAGLINEEPRVPITVLPSGTENLFARYFRINHDPDALARMILEGRAIRTDLGRLGSRRFSLMAGFGFDAAVVSRHHLLRVAAGGLPKPTNRVAYVEPVLHSSLTYRFPPISVAIEDSEGSTQETLVGTTVFLFNLPSYALNLPFVPGARADDGLLDLIVFRKPGPFQALHYLWLVIRGLHLNCPDIDHRRVRRVSISTEESVPVQLDGDPDGKISPGASSARAADVLPGAIDVLVPTGYQ
jgi:diacylglycerol kinase (ATP)